MTTPTNTPLDVGEFARRLCAANHPMFATTGAAVPCGQHVQEAHRLWGMTQQTGSASFRVLVEARTAGGVAPIWAIDLDLLEAAWGIIANAGGGDWSTQTPEWQAAARRWRDLYHEARVTAILVAPDEVPVT